MFQGSFRDYSYPPTPYIETLESSQESSLQSTNSEDVNMGLKRRLSETYDSSIGRPKPRFTHNSSTLTSEKPNGIEFRSSRYEKYGYMKYR